MQRNFFSYVAAFTLLVSFTNCATILSGAKQPIVISSDPKKAKVEIDGMNVGNTPFITKLSTRSRHLVKVELDGYTPYEITLTKKLNGWIFGNILLGGIIGIGVDAATGAMFRLTPKDVAAELKTSSTTANNKQDGIYLAVVLKPKTTWEKIGQMTPTP